MAAGGMRGWGQSVFLPIEKTAPAPPPQKSSPNCGQRTRSHRTLLWLVGAVTRPVYGSLYGISGSVRGAPGVALGGVVGLAGPMLDALAGIPGRIFGFMSCVLHVLLGPVIFLTGVRLLAPCPGRSCGQRSSQQQCRYSRSHGHPWEDSRRPDGVGLQSKGQGTGNWDWGLGIRH